MFTLQATSKGRPVRLGSLGGYIRRANKKVEKYFRDNYGDKWNSPWNYRHYPIDIK